MTADPLSVTLSIPPRRELVALARGVVVEVARRHGIGAERVEDIRLIVSEAVTNAVQAYLRRGSGRPADLDRIDIRFDASAGRFEITVRDSYGGPEVPLEAPFAAPTSTSATGGFGLPIMDSLSDELWVREIDGGLEIRAVILER